MSFIIIFFVVMCYINYFVCGITSGYQISYSILFKRKLEIREVWALGDWRIICKNKLWLHQSFHLNLIFGSRIILPAFHLWNWSSRSGLCKKAWSSHLSTRLFNWGTGAVILPVFLYIYILWICHVFSYPGGQVIISFCYGSAVTSRSTIICIILISPFSSRQNYR